MNHMSNNVHNPNFLVLVLLIGLSNAVADDLVTSCPEAFAQPVKLGESCMARLDSSFIAEPIWEKARLKHYRFNYRHQHLSVMNVRDRYVTYSTAAMAENAPLWSDVFDGEIETRNQLALQVFNDQECRDLRDDSVIRPELATRCNSEELIRYSMYIDACATAFSRVQILSSPDLINTETGEKMTWFEHNLDMVDVNADMDHTSKAEVTEAYLHAAWVSEKCNRMPITPIVDSEQLDGSRRTLKEVIELFRINHDVALRIAAKSGNQWAQRMYFPNDLPIMSEYMQSLQNQYPVMAHRLMASDLMRGVLSVKARVHHAMKAHELEAVDTNLFEYLEQFRFYDADLEPLREELIEGMAVELQYPW